MHVEKPVLPREVADALDAARSAKIENAILIDVRNDEFYCSVPGVTSAVLRSVPFDTLLAALVNGYEREMTEEEQAHEAIRGMYHNYKSAEAREGWPEALRRAIAAEDALRGILSAIERGDLAQVRLSSGTDYVINNAKRVLADAKTED